MIKSQQQILQNPPILRVLRKDGAHLCGICRTTYLSNEHAVECLNRCWKMINERGHGIMLISDLGQEKYLCLFCFRHYRLPGEAQACADDCAAKGETKLRRLNLLPHLPQEQRTKRTFQTATTTFSRLPNQRGKVKANQSDGAVEKQHETEMADIAAPGGAQEGHEPPGTGAPSQEPEKITVNPTKTVKEHKKRHRNEFPKQFSRHNAKYMCLVCNSEYFTKTEVEACFSGHFDEEGYYVEKPAA